MQWIILYNLAGYEFQSCAYDNEKSADWLMNFVRGLGSHQWSKKVPLTAQALADHFNG